MAKVGLIYKATSPSGKVYVGQCTCSLVKRKIKHRQDAKRYSYAFANAIRKKYKSGKYSYKDLAKEYGVCFQIIGLVINNNVWSK